MSGLSRGYYSTVEMLEALTAGDRPTAFLKDTFFSEARLFDTEEVAFDKLQRRRRIAPYVIPTIAGKAERSRGREIKSFIPPYVKPKHEITPADSIPRAVDENFGGELAPMERYEAAMLDNLELEEYEIVRAEEQQCASILRTGMLTVEGENHPKKTIDYGRNAAHTIALTGAARWGEAGVSIVDNLTEWMNTIQKNSTGIVTTLIVGTGAGGLLQKDPEIRDVLDNRRQMGGEFQFGPIATGAEDMVAAYLGNYGQLEIMQYSQYFEDDAGNTVNVWPEYGVCAVAKQRLGGVMTYGAIKDNKALKAMKRFPKHWGEEDPSVDFTMTQSAPLAVPRDIDASLFALVR